MLQKVWDEDVSEEHRYWVTRAVVFQALHNEVIYDRLSDAPLQEKHRLQYNCNQLRKSNASLKKQLEEAHARQ